MISIIYSTFPSKEEADKISKILIKEGLVACANIFNSNSFYKWNNQICDDNEFILIMKTSEDKIIKVKKIIKKHHPYEVPCIIDFNVNLNKEYSDWLGDQLSTT